ncbi:hypothetical protein L6452_22570 [Arctium lappa]|uniref:Uncharacterized protein n=1 Tax=Arctium lappa TaxID=4217 RepID=A0ACB9B134_ARCLA|nr:hypothetical protein L6452_22570 [Arctium lappa]
MENTVESNSTLVSKVPMLRSNEFDMWKIRIKQYILLTDYSMWDIIENGPSDAGKIGEDGKRTPPKTDAERKTRQTEMKALSTLLLTIPNEYQHQFCNCTDAQMLWNALEKRFSGTKSTKRNQKAILKQQYENFMSTKNESMTQTFDRFNKLIGELATMGVQIDQDDVNINFLRSLGDEWTMYTVSFRQNEQLEEKELDDLYNDLRVFEVEVEAKKKPSGYIHNAALLSASIDSTANPESVNAANGANQEKSTESVFEAFLSSYGNSSLINDDLEQLHPDDLEEMDIKWQMAMLSMWVKKECRSGVSHNNNNNNHQQAQSGNLNHNRNSAQALVSQQGIWFDWSDQAEEAIQNQALMAEVSDLPTEEQIKGFQANELQHSHATNYWKWEKKDLELKLTKSKEESEKLREELTKVKLDVEKFSNASKAMDSLLQTQIHDKLRRGIGYNATPPPYNNNYIPPTLDFLETKDRKDFPEGSTEIDPLDEVVVEDKTEKEVGKSKENNLSGEIPLENNIITNEDCGRAWIKSKDIEKTEGKSGKKERNHVAKKYVKSKSHMKKKTVKESVNMWVPKSTKTVSTATTNSATDNDSAARSNTTATNVSAAKSISTANMVSTFSNVNTVNSVSAANKVSTAKPVSAANSVSTSKGNQQLKGKSIWHVDSGCSRHMTGNMSCLKNFKKIDGGHVAFGNTPDGGKISGKGDVTKGKMTFEDVFYVEKLRTKDETSGLIKSFILRIENQTNQKVKVIRSDNGTEFKNHDLNTFCEEKGIERQYNAPRTPQQNGVAERRNRTLIEAARSLLADSKLPITFWTEAVNTVCYVQNRVLVVKPKNKTPYELLNKRKPFIGFFKPFGCPCTILNTKTHLGKFDSKADDGFLVGYSSQSKAYRVFNTSSRIIEESDNVKCNENTPNPIGSGPQWLFDIDSLTNSLGFSSDYHEASGSGGSEDDQVQVQDIIPQVVIFPIPTIESVDVCAKETMTDPIQSEEEGRDEENQVHEEPEEADEIPSADLNDSNLDVGINEEPSHQTITQKNHPPELVIGDIYSPMITRNQSRLQELQDQQHTVLSCFLSQIEPKKVYDAMKDSSWIEAMQEELLQFKLQEVWDLVDLPKGHRAIGTKWIFRNKKDERGIVIRNKARLVAQGYTQEKGIDYEEVFAPVARVEAIRLFLAYASYMKFKVYQMDVKSAFLYGTIDEEVYVCQPPGFENPSYPDRVYKLKKALYGLHQAPRACSMGELTFFLGLQVKQKKDGIIISQSKYVKDILDKYGLTDSKPASTPMETHKQITADLEGEDVDVHLYRLLIGSLMYLTALRPDIMFPVCLCARFQVKPKQSHLQAIQRIFRYLRGKPRLGLWYPYESNFDLIAYSDIDLGGANMDRKSTSGGCQLLGARLVSWQCKKQTIVSLSTTEAEYIAAASCCSQVLWIQNQMLDYGVTFLHTPIFIDNSSAISIVNNPVKHSKTKHIEIRYHFIKDCNEKKLIQAAKVHTDNQFADLFTKAFDVVDSLSWSQVWA